MMRFPVRKKFFGIERLKAEYPGRHENQTCRPDDVDRQIACQSALHVVGGCVINDAGPGQAGIFKECTSMAATGVRTPYRTRKYSSPTTVHPGSLSRQPPARQSNSMMAKSVSHPGIFPGHIPIEPATAETAESRGARQELRNGTVRTLRAGCGRAFPGLAAIQPVPGLLCACLWRLQR